MTEEQKTENVFDQVEEVTVEEPTVQETTQEKPKVLPGTEHLNPGLVEPEPEFGELSDTNAEETKIVLEEEDKDKVFEIESVEVLKPLLKDALGNKVEPSQPQGKGNPYYSSKLKVKYKDTTYTSFLPNIKWYVNVDNGKTTLNPWFNRKCEEEDLDNALVSTITKLYFRFCKANGYEVGKLTMADFVNGLPGKKVKLKQYKSKNPDTGQIGYRIDIKEFVKEE